MKRILLFVVILALAGCGTTSPSFQTPDAASFGADGLRDSGVKGVAINTRTKAKELILTAEDRAAYNALIAVYGGLFTPPLAADEGLTPFGDDYAMGNEYATDYGLMIGWKANGIHPGGKP
jgi:hypothetical protein